MDQSFTNYSLRDANLKHVLCEKQQSPVCTLLETFTYLHSEIVNT